MTQEQIRKIIKEEGNYKAGVYKKYKWRIIRPKYHPGENEIGVFHLCGYVGLPKKSKFYKVPYDDIPVDVHGGLTYDSDNLHMQPETNLWWIGFDCAHSGDLCMLYSYLGPVDIDDVYRDMEYVENEVKSLIDQLIELELKP